MQVDQQEAAKQYARMKPSEQHGMGRPVYSLRQLMSFTALQLNWQSWMVCVTKRSYVYCLGFATLFVGVGWQVVGKQLGVFDCQWQPTHTELVFSDDILRGNQLRNSKRFQAAMSTAAGISSGDFRLVMEASQVMATTTSDLNMIENLPDRTKHAGLVSHGPAGSTLSKSKYRLDLLLILCRQQEWLEQGIASKWVSLCN